MDQAEDVPVVLLQPLLQIAARSRPGRLFVCDAAANEGLVDLAVEIGPVGHQQEGEIALQFPPHLLGEERHRIGLAAALRVPEHAEPSEVGMRTLDDIDGPLRNEGGWRLGKRPRFFDLAALQSRRNALKRQLDNTVLQPLLQRKFQLQIFLPRH